MNQVQDVIIIGAGTAGLSAFKEVNKFTKNVLVIDRGPLGTTCARVGCMPSKALIQVAEYYGQRHLFTRMGIKGANRLSVDLPEVMEYVRNMRDHFTKGVVEFTQSLGEQFICGEAKLIDEQTVQVNDFEIKAKAIIITTGSKSKIPAPWAEFKEKIISSETIFEQKDLPPALAVIGAGSIGLEFGQSLSRLGVDISLFNAGGYIGGLSDPKVNQVAIDIFKQSFSLYLNEPIRLKNHGDGLMVSGKQDLQVPKAVIAIGREPNLDALSLKHLNLPYDESGQLQYDSTTMQIGDTSLFLAGDVNAGRPLLHEAADEGRIAGFNAVHPIQCFKRRAPLKMLFTNPNIAVIGQSFQSLSSEPIAIGEVDFSDQGRAKVMQKNKGILRVYGQKKNGVLLGAELIAPDGEHMAHLLAWAIDKHLTVFDVLQMPFYHPTIEEGMRTAMRDLGRQVEERSSDFDLAICDSEAVAPLS